MPELLPQERLQPSLLDRLTDDEPAQNRESREKRVLSMQQLRRSVLRDLEWLLNTGRLEDVASLEQYPEVAQSVINYGMPDLAGSTASGLDAVEIEAVVRKTIQDFEPRILRKSVKVRVLSAPDEMSRNSLSFEIEGDLWAQPLPLQLYLKTEVDLEAGTFRVTEQAD